ncbi:hypothetical protein RI367_002438 [Sorochytrium milnesiophthora]
MHSILTILAAVVGSLVLPTTHGFLNYDYYVDVHKMQTYFRKLLWNDAAQLELLPDTDLSTLNSLTVNISDTTKMSDTDKAVLWLEFSSGKSVAYGLSYDGNKQRSLYMLSQGVKLDNVDKADFTAQPLQIRWQMPETMSTGEVMKQYADSLPKVKDGEIYVKVDPNSSSDVEPDNDTNPEHTELIRGTRQTHPSNYTKTPAKDDPKLSMDLQEIHSVGNFTNDGPTCKLQVSRAADNPGTWQATIGCDVSTNNPNSPSKQKWEFPQWSTDSNDALVTVSLLKASNSAAIWRSSINITELTYTSTSQTTDTPVASAIFRSLLARQYDPFHDHQLLHVVKTDANWLALFTGGTTDTEAEKWLDDPDAIWGQGGGQILTPGGTPSGTPSGNPSDSQTDREMKRLQQYWGVRAKDNGAPFHTIVAQHHLGGVGAGISSADQNGDEEVDSETAPSSASKLKRSSYHRRLRRRLAATNGSRQSSAEVAQPQADADSDPSAETAQAQGKSHWGVGTNVTLFVDDNPACPFPELWLDGDKQLEPIDLSNVGKSTTLAKLAEHMRNENRKKKCIQTNFDGKWCDLHYNKTTQTWKIWEA